MTRISPSATSRPTDLLRLCLLGLTLVLGAASVVAQTASPAAGAGRVRVAGSFRAVAPVGKTTADTSAETLRDSLSEAEASAPMRVQLALRMRNAAELERRVNAGEIITREEMAARFLPLASDHQAVADWLAAQGLTVRPAGASHAVVSATGKPAQLEQAFEAHFARVQFHGEEYRSTTVAPSLPAGIAARVHGVHGLQPHLRPRKPVVSKDATTNEGQLPFYVGDILNSYDVPAAGLTGAGEVIGIIIDHAPLDSDLAKFWSINGIPQDLSNVSTVNVEGGDLGNPEGEETLDVEWSSGIASGARIVIYAAGDLNSIEDAYGSVIDDLQSGAQPHLHQISMSFGAGEVSDETPDDIASVHEMFAAIAAYGVNLFASSGDSGAFGNDEGKIEVSYPASDPLIVAVGATALVLDGKDTVLSETGWSVTGRRNDHGSSGGGVSVVFDRPSWQVGAGVDLTAMRQVPDVSINGDPRTAGYVFLNGEATGFGGTSLSSPIWAGLCALINQGRASKGLPPLSRLDPKFYPLLGSSAFHDITDGDDAHYLCTPGYDLLTGIGSPDFNVLYQHLLTVSTHPAFFSGEAALSNGVYYLAFPNGNYFGYYTYLDAPQFIYHFDLGYEYVFDANDGANGIYLYDFASKTFFYTSPSFPFPYLYDFSLNSVVYYYPDANRAGHYSTSPRYFYDFGTGTVITK